VILRSSAGRPLPGYESFPQDILDSKILPQIPLARLGKPEEVAGLIIYLYSDEAAFLTGANLAINGGQHTQTREMTYGNLKIDPDEMLKSLATEAVKGSEHVRAAIRDLTLRALQARELSLKQIGTVVRKVAEGVNLGIADEKGNVEKILSDAFAGMDEALLKVVEANKVVLEKLTEGGATFDQSGIKKGLKELEAFEEKFLDGIKAAARKASDHTKEQWTAILGNIQPGGTDSGARAAETFETYAHQAKSAIRSSRETGLKLMHSLTQNYATLVSGVLIGLSEALEHGKSKNSR